MKAIATGGTFGELAQNAMRIAEEGGFGHESVNEDVLELFGTLGELGFSSHTRNRVLLGILADDDNGYYTVKVTESGELGLFALPYEE